MHQVYFGLGPTPVPAGGAYVVPPDTLAGFKGLRLRGGKGWEEREREERGRKGMGRKGGRVGEFRVPPPTTE